MKCNYKKNNHSGFTLAEVLIVVAIIAVLVAISIPIFTKQLEKTREATCMANRRGLKAELSAEYMSGDGTWKYDVDTPRTATNEQCKCPSGGNITFWQTADGSFEVSCSKHSGMNSSTVSSIFDVLKDNGYLKHQIDSNAPMGNNNYKDNFLSELSKVGIDLSSMGVKTWGYKYNDCTVNNITYKYMLLFTSEDITGKANVGLVMRARISENGDILYSIWEGSKVGENTNIISGEKYNVLTTTAKKEVDYKNYTVGIDKTNFDEMKALYNEIAKEKGMEQLR